MSILVYIAGPYTHPDPVDNTRTAMEAANRLMDSGVCVPHIPHLTLFWHLHTPRPVGRWYAYDLEILGRCDAVLRLLGASVGADNEVEYAGEHGIPVFHEVEKLFDWCARKPVPR